jgi:hypothetical protein
MTVRFFSTVRTLSYLSMVILFASSLIAARAQSTSVGGGTLSWSVTQSTGKCGPQQPPQYSFTEWSFSSFNFLYGGTNYPLGGSAAYIQDNNSTTGCPPNGPEGGTFALPSSLGFGNSCLLNFTAASGGQGSATLGSSCQQGVSGYVDPKYVVVGITYAPPGPSVNTFVNYVNSTYVGNTTTTSNSFASGNTFSVSLSYSAGIPGFAKGVFTGSYAQTGTQTTKKTSTVTTSVQIDNGEETFGTGNYFAPVDNDYDVIWVWLNSVSLYTITGTSIAWNGYGYDATDQNGMDIIGIPLGYLNGHFGSMPEQYLVSTNRTWAAGQMFKAGQSTALNSTDFAQIAAFDPFSVSTYGVNDIGVNPPSPSTSDNRFTLTACNGGNSFPYDQAAPSSTAQIFTCKLTYVNLSTQAQAITNSFSQTYSVDASFSGGTWFSKFTLDIKNSYTLTWTTESDNSITTSTTNSGLFSVQGPACNNSVLGVGPCIPVYDASGNEPVQFNVYQDNMFGTFMFAPVHYY